MSGIKGTGYFSDRSSLSSHYLILLIGSDLVFGVWSKVVVVNFEGLADFPALERSFYRGPVPFHHVSHDFGFEIHERRQLTTV